jgi:transposase-like protein
VQVNITHLVDDVQCYQTVRELRWPHGVVCPACESTQVIKRGFDDTEPGRQRYACHNCDTRFDDLTNTIFSGHHQSLKVWILCLYFMGLNVLNEQIAHELSLKPTVSLDVISFMAGGCGYYRGQIEQRAAH